MNLALASFVYLFNSIAQVLNGIFIKYASAKYGFNLYVLILVKSTLGFFILYPFAKKYFDKLKTNLFKISMLAIFASLDILLWNVGLSTIAANEATLIMLCIPIWILILSRVILKEAKMKTFDYIGIFIAFAAVLLVMTGGNMTALAFSEFKIGHFIIFINTFIVAFGLVLQKKFSDSRPIPLALLTNNIATFFIVSLLLNNKSFEININSTMVWVGILVLFLDMIEMISVYKAYQMANLALLQPIRFTRIIFSIIFSFILLHESPTTIQMIATTMIIAGNVLIILYNRRK